MESSQHKDSKKSNEESDHQQEQVNDVDGIGRSYECVFCKRGFTTAQALGGHMNIHRRDRAKIRQPSAIPPVSNQSIEEYATPAYFQTISNHPPYYFPAHQTPMGYQMYVPPSTSSTRHPHPYYADDLHIQKSRSLNWFKEDRCINLSLQIGPTRKDEKEEQQRQDKEEDELDLELRLGHDP